MLQITSNYYSDEIFNRIEFIRLVILDRYLFETRRTILNSVSNKCVAEIIIRVIFFSRIFGSDSNYSLFIVDCSTILFE